MTELSTDRLQWLSATAIALRNGDEIDRETIASFLEDITVGIHTEYEEAKQDVALCQKYQEGEYEYRAVFMARALFMVQDLELDSPSLKG